MMPDASGNMIMAGIWERVNGKGFVYYPKKAWDQAGYKVPTTFAQLQTLMDQIGQRRHASVVHWHESGSATGWVATDWIENIMLRTTTPESTMLGCKGN